MESEAVLYECPVCGYPSVTAPAGIEPWRIVAACSYRERIMVSLHALVKYLGEKTLSADLAAVNLNVAYALLSGAVADDEMEPECKLRRSTELVLSAYRLLTSEEDDKPHLREQEK